MPLAYIHSGILTKLIIFALSLGLVPISSYFVSRDYLWEGTSVCIPIRMSTHSLPYREHHLCRHYCHRLGERSASCIHNRVCTRRVASNSAREGATDNRVEERQVDSSVLSRSSPVQHSTVSSNRAYYSILTSTSHSVTTSTGSTRHPAIYRTSSRPPSTCHAAQTLAPPRTSSGVDRP